MKRGRPPLTLAKLLARDPASLTRGHAPAEPEWLDDLALAEWRRVVSDLDALGFLSSTDSGTIARYAALTVAAQALDPVSPMGLKAYSHLLQMETVMGLNALGRVRVCGRPPTPKADPSAPVSPLEQFRGTGT